MALEVVVSVERARDRLSPRTRAALARLLSPRTGKEDKENRSKGSLIKQRKKENLSARSASTEDQSDPPSPSRALRRKYHVLEHVAEGASCSVWRCVDRKTGEAVACKVLRKEHLALPMTRCHVGREVCIMNLLRALKHDGVVHLRYVCEGPASLELVMEYCSGGTLFSHIARRGAFPEEKAKAVFEQLARSLQLCHQHGIVHRDIKPENILLVSDEDPLSGELRAKLADFGLSLTLPKGTSTSQGVGTVSWTAPEILSGRKYGLAVDVWSLGAVLLAMLTGSLPQYCTDISSEAPVWQGLQMGRFYSERVDWTGISETAQDLAERMLQRDPRLRLRSDEILSHP